MLFGDVQNLLHEQFDSSVTPCGEGLLISSPAVLTLKTSLYD